MDFEYDANKSASNKIKHNIDFEEAKELFNDAFAIIYPANQTKEERYFVTGMIKEKYYTAIITFRNENIRIISVRRSRDKEIKFYKRNKDENDNG